MILSWRGGGCTGIFDAAGIESPRSYQRAGHRRLFGRACSRKGRGCSKKDWKRERQGDCPAGDECGREGRAGSGRDQSTARLSAAVKASAKVNYRFHQKNIGSRVSGWGEAQVRQGMGRCQAGFCTPRTMEILSRELGITMEEVCKNAPGSNMLTGQK